jgi:hypothetical protein
MGRQFLTIRVLPQQPYGQLQIHMMMKMVTVMLIVVAAATVMMMMMMIQQLHGNAMTDGRSIIMNWYEMIQLD